MARQKVRHNKFIFQDGKCYWCNNSMTIRRSTARRTPDNYATFEHLVDRFDSPDRTQGHQVVVLACNKCNRERNDAKQRNLPLLDAWYRNWQNGNDVGVPRNLKYLF